VHEQAEEDSRLLQRIALRDESALAALYDMRCRLVFGLALRIVGNRAEAEEVLQEVFIQVWTKIETYKPELGTPLAWLVRIARNRAIDRLRSNSVRDRVAMDGGPSEPPVDDVEAQLSRIEAQRAVLHALGALPRDQRELIEHAFFLGLTHVELAERFKLPLGTVKTRVRTGLMSLKRDLAAVARFHVQV